jgi:hypothetical protein
VTARGPAIHAVRSGPALIHAYSQFTGGDLFVVPAVTGTDTDCAGVGTNRAANQSTPIVADRRAVVHVDAGQLACVAVQGERGFELLWHAVEEPAFGSAPSRLAAPPAAATVASRPAPAPPTLASCPPAPPTLVGTLPARGTR